MSFIDEFARSILFGTTLEEKLLEQNQVFDRDKPAVSAVDVPVFPGRPLALSSPGKASFPSLHRLYDPSVRGEVLHFFANHELLAMELMALVLLRFPEAPLDFRQGIVRTIQEEQSHMRLYLERMKELGVSFGDLPVSDYFWKTMRGMKSPMDFVIQMSLTFEQANLDFSLFYMNAVREVGDVRTADILEKVFREEIGHVKHGLTWFNRWRKQNSESEWEAYSRLLPLPMTPQRAKGNGFSMEARKSAGFSEDYIRKLSLFNGSKGRPPVIWIYNPHCDSEIARGKPGFTATEGARRLSEDLQCTPLFLASEQDQVVVETQPSENWVAELQDAGFKTPEFVRQVRAPKIGGIQPWGWSPDSFSDLGSLKDKLVDTSDGNSRWVQEIFKHPNYQGTGIGRLFSKTWSVEFLREWMMANPSSDFGSVDTVGKVLSDIGEVQTEIERILVQGRRVMLKAPYGTSGMQVKEIRNLSEIRECSPMQGWIQGVLSAQKSIVVERFLDKIIDFSVQMEVGPEQLELFDARFFMTGSRHEYRGSFLGKKHPVLSAEQTRFLFSTLGRRIQLIRDLGQRLRQFGYQGPVGVDSLLYLDQGEFKVKAVVEINPRWTMGRVALELEKKLAPGVSGYWIFVPVKAILASRFKTVEGFTAELKTRYPLEMVQAGGGSRIQSGVVFTNDPAQAREVLSVMGTFSAADADNLRLGNIDQTFVG